MTIAKQAIFTASICCAFFTGAAAQDAPLLPPGADTGNFVEVIPTEGRAAVRIASAHVVRVARVEGHTVIDTTAWVQQRTVEPVEVVARRFIAAGQRMVALTDLSNRPIYLAVDRVVLVRESEERHAPSARAAIVMVGLRFNTDIAVRETANAVIAALKREAQGRQQEPPAVGTTR
jgi:hypothetical protein